MYSAVLPAARCQHDSCQEVPSGAWAYRGALCGPALAPHQPLPAYLVGWCAATFASGHGSDALPIVHWGQRRLHPQHLGHCFGQESRPQLLAVYL